MEVSKGQVEELRGNAYSGYLQQDTIPDGLLILDTPEMLCNPKNLLEAIRPASKGEVVQDVVDWVMLYSSLNGIDFIVGQLDVLYVLVYGNGEGFFLAEEMTEAVGEDHILAWLILDGVVIFLHVE